MLYDVG